MQFILLGTVTDGEFCSLRSQGETRLLHLWQIIHDSREKVGKMSKKTLLNMLELLYGKGYNQGEIKHIQLHLKRKIPKQISFIPMLKMFVFSNS